MTRPTEQPLLVFADADGQVLDAPGVVAAGRYGDAVRPLPACDLVPLPPGSELYVLPQRAPIGFEFEPASSRPVTLDGLTSVAAFLPPGYVALALAAYRSLPGAPMLPLYAYAAVCWCRGKFHVPAIRVERDPKHDPAQFDDRTLRRLVRRSRERLPGNRLVHHLADNCALRYGCANAKNLFYGRWECPIPVSPACNAACVGCISAQPDSPVPAPQDRLPFVPSIDEVLAVAVPHLESASRAMISFGQGCEGEPLVQAELIAEIIAAVRRQTDRGTIHLNTNGSRPDALDRLCAAGLDSVRISLNSAQPALYTRYYRPRNYGFADVAESVALARRRGLFTSINYLTFPGFTDSSTEITALVDLIRQTDLNMIQWRNLNIDPEVYTATIGLNADEPARGLRAMIAELRAQFPQLRHGYLNPPRESWAEPATNRA
jgi:molybdenum cofactor biosynthesis enzyme MoaA